MRPPALDMPQGCGFGALLVVFAVIAILAAQGIEAATADETGTGSALGESPVTAGHAPEPCTQTHTTKKKGE